MDAMTQRERQILQCIEADPMISQQKLADQLGITRSSVGVHIYNLMRKGYIAGKGYVLRSGSYAAVVGGVNMDIGGLAYEPLVAADSNPGKITMSLGGVGRNIAHNMCLMGVDVRLLTAYGDDVYGEKVSASCSETGIDITHALRVKGGTTSTYLFISGPDGDMAMALSDMAICDQITPGYLSSNLTVLQNAQVIVCDTNVPQESLIFLAENAKVPLFCDPVSTAKAEKLLPILSRIHTLKPNRIEAELLSGVAIADAGSLHRAAQVLLDTGLRRVFISLGSQGVYAASHEGALLLPCRPAEPVNATGAGDAFMAGLAWAYLEGTDLKGTALAGASAGAIAIEGAGTINPTLCAAALRARMNQ